MVYTKLLKDLKEARAISSLLLFFITVYPFIYERVNRYTVSYLNMLTLSAMYGKMFLHRKGCEEANI